MTTQSPHMDRIELEAILGLPEEAVRIKPTAVGGGFGSKLDLSVQPYLALAAWTLGRPVRLTYTRPESMMSTTKRHPSRLRARDRRHARRPAHRDGLHRRVQHRGVRIVGFDGGEPRPGARRRSVRLRRVSRAHRGHPHERATVGRVPRVRRAAIDDRAGMPVRRARGRRGDGSPRVPPPQRAHGGRADGHRSGVRHRVSGIATAWRRCVRIGSAPGPRRRRRTPMAARRAAASASPACGTAAGTRRCRTPRRSRSASGATDASRSIKERSTWDRAPTP